MSNFVDITIDCKQCGQPFVLTAQEQEWFAAKTNDDGQPFQQPKRCKSCRQNKQQRPGTAAPLQPAAPTGGRPVVIETGPEGGRGGKRGGRGRRRDDIDERY